MTNTHKPAGKKAEGRSPATEAAGAPGWRPRDLNPQETREQNLRERNAELHRIFRRLLMTMPMEPGESFRAHYHRAHEAAGLSRATSYFVSFEYARRMIRRLRREKPEEARRKGRGKWAELRERTDALKRRERLDEDSALARVLCEGGASCFFLSAWGVARAIGQHREYERRERRRKWREYREQRNEECREIERQKRR